MNGTLPDLSALTNLTNVFLANNQLSGQVPDLSALNRLRILVLDSNPLTGPIPDLSALTNLTSLALSNTQLTGPIPDLSALTNLTRLSISTTNVSGPFPDISALTKLRVVYLGRNQYTSGSISDLSPLTDLRVLGLRASQLTGSIPDLTANTLLSEVDLGENRFSGPVPDLNSLTNLRRLSLDANQLTGSFPDLSSNTDLLHLDLASNQFSGVISDLSALTKLTGLNLSGNEFTGTVPNLSALTALQRLDLSDNQLNGSFPDLSLLTDLTRLDLSSNQLTGPILDVGHFTKLAWLTLNDNQLTGPIPDFSALTNLRGLFLAGNRLCLPAGATLSHSNATVSSQLNRLNLPACSSSETTLAPDVPQNVTTTVNNNQVSLSWNAVSNASSYELRSWDSLERQWGPIGGMVSTTTYTHSVRTDGRIYYYQIRARDANGMRGPWSDRVQAIVVPQQFPPPPLSLGLDIFYQKYANASGITVVAPSEVSDEKMALVRDVVTGMLSTRSDLLDILVDYPSRVVIYKRNEDGEGITQLPEFYFLSNNVLGYVHDGADAIIIGVPAVEPYCNTLVHEMAHAVHFAIDELPEGPDFDARVHALYQSALNAGRWQGLYASRNHREYWAEMVQFWFQETMPISLIATYPTLSDYDPEAAKLVEEVFGSATVPADCKP